MDLPSLHCDDPIYLVCLHHNSSCYYPLRYYSLVSLTIFDWTNIASTPLSSKIIKLVSSRNLLSTWYTSQNILHSSELRCPSYFWFNDDSFKMMLMSVRVPSNNHFRREDPIFNLSILVSNSIFRVLRLSSLTVRISPSD